MKPFIAVTRNTLGGVVEALVRELRECGMTLYPEAAISYYPPRTWTSNHTQVFAYYFFVGEPGSLRNVACYIPDTCDFTRHVQTFGPTGRQWRHGHLERPTKDLVQLIACAEDALAAPPGEQS